MHEGGFQGSTYEDLQCSFDFFDQGRSLNHIPKIELVKGNFLLKQARDSSRTTLTSSLHCFTLILTSRTD